RTCTFDLPCQCLPLTAPNNVDLTVAGCAALAGPLIMSKGSVSQWYYTSGLIGGCTYTIEIIISASGGNINVSFLMCEYHWASGLAYFYSRVPVLGALFPCGLRGTTKY